jgi:predicted RNase H-like HicB family nuclease
VGHYIAIAEPDDDGKTWWISFPGLDGVTSAADGPGEIATRAAEALASAADAGVTLPPAIEDGAIPQYDNADYRNPLVVLVPYAGTVSEVAEYPAGSSARSVDATPHTPRRAANRRPRPAGRRST